MELLQNPLKSETMVVVHGAKDVIVPFVEVGIFLIEKMEFILKEPMEMPKHEGGWWLLGWVDTTPVEEGLDGAMRVRVAQVWDKGVGVGKR